MENIIGIDQSNAEKLSEKLNALLSNYEVYYQNLRGFHWNVIGSNFFELHEKFEELYTRAHDYIDEIAERILTLEGKPLHTFTDFLANSRIKESRNIEDGVEMVKVVLDNLRTIVGLEREVLSEASEAGDEGTASLISDYIKEQEKTIWMLNAYVK